MSYTESIHILTRDCDLRGGWRPSALLEAMQEVATAHCEAAGLGRGATDALGIAWVLSRSRVELNRLPRLGENVFLETYATPPRHLFFPRAYVLRGEGGEDLGGATSLWLLMDLTTRKAVASPFVAERLPIEDRPAPVGMPGTVRPLNGAPEVETLAPRYTEFDLNGHVNNTKYLDWCWNALGFEGLEGRELAGFDVNYDREILPGEILRTELCREGDAASFCGYADGARCFGIRAELRREAAR